MDYIKRQKDARWKNNTLLFKMKVPLPYYIYVVRHYIKTINLDLSLPIIYI